MSQDAVVPYARYSRTLEAKGCPRSVAVSFLSNIFDLHFSVYCIFVIQKPLSGERVSSNGHQKA
jgi:hypothetical protein